MRAPGDVLHERLEVARAAGFLGPGPIGPHIRHAEGFAVAAEDALGRTPASYADLGTGGGIPGLVLALRWPGIRAVFVDSNSRRAAGLVESVAALDLDDRVEVAHERAELVGRNERLRERFELVTARSFAEPAVTAEIGTGLLAVDGILVVSEPPESDGSRWDSAGLAELGFGAASVVGSEDAHFAVLTKLAPTPARFPRGVGRPAKRPLW